MNEILHKYVVKSNAKLSTVASLMRYQFIAIIVYGYTFLLSFYMPSQ